MSLKDIPIEKIEESFGSFKISKGPNEDYYSLVIEKNRICSSVDQNKVILRLEPFEVDRLSFMKDVVERTSC